MKSSVPSRAGQGSTQRPTLFVNKDKSNTLSPAPKKGWAAPRRSFSSPDGSSSLDLFGACASGQLQLAKELVAAGQPIEAKDAQRRTPLHYAVMGDHVELVEYLCAQGAEPTVTTPKGIAPLHEAVSGEVAEILVRPPESILPPRMGHLAGVH